MPFIYIHKLIAKTERQRRSLDVLPTVSASDRDPLVYVFGALNSLFRLLSSRVAFPGRRRAYFLARTLGVARHHRSRRP